MLKRVQTVGLKQGTPVKLSKTKICPKCKKELPITGFSSNAYRKDGVSYTCGKCEQKRRKKHYDINKENPVWLKKQKDRAFKSRLHHYFDITIDEYDNMIELQNGVCAICGQIETNGRRLSVDHNHGTGKIRELLCRKCNTGLGQFNDDAKLLKIAIQYLKKHTYKRPV